MNLEEGFCTYIYIFIDILTGEIAGMVIFRVLLFLLKDILMSLYEIDNYLRP